MSQGVVLNRRSTVSHQSCPPYGLFFAELARPAVIRLVSAIRRIEGHIESGADINITPHRSRSSGWHSESRRCFGRRQLTLFAELAWPAPNGLIGAVRGAERMVKARTGLVVAETRVRSLGRPQHRLIVGL